MKGFNWDYAIRCLVRSIIVVLFIDSVIDMIKRNINRPDKPESKYYLIKDNSKTIDSIKVEEPLYISERGSLCIRPASKVK